LSNKTDKSYSKILSSAEYDCMTLLSDTIQALNVARWSLRDATQEWADTSTMNMTTET